ncbi:MAG: tetratricopeptide repeat protein [Deltaproteobacteria bacterium]|nr:tetratricopeptide repeat protein [Deltaproteobacteria bacterium]
MSVQYFRQAYEAQTHGDIGEAIMLYQKSIETFPTPEALTFLGWAMSFLGKFQEAIDICKKAIELDPESGNPYNDIGAYMIELGRWDEAIPYLERASQSSKYDTPWFSHYNLGRIYEQKGMIFKAKQCYQRAVEENPEYVLASESLEQLKYSLN